MNQTVNSTKHDVIESIKKEQSPVVIFGAGVVAEALFYACIEAGIKVECFCDNNINKTNLLLCELKVIHAPDLKTQYRDAVFLISAADIKDVISQLQSLGYSKWHASSLLLRDFDIFKHTFSAPVDFVEYAVATCLLCHDSYFEPEKLFLRSVDIIITERCSLKCRDCSNLMQYYKKPHDCNSGDLLESIGMFCDIINEVNEFRVIGGEPFMNKEFHLIAERLIDEPKARKIVFYTNGTIIPNDEQLKSLMHKKVLVIITDYGALSKKIAALMHVLKERNISFYSQKAHGWTDCSKITKRNRSIEEGKELFASCCAKNTITYSDGKLYRCPFSANADRLLAVAACENDFIDIVHWQKTAMGIDEIRAKIKEFLLRMDFLKVCDYCSGRSFTAIEISPAIQIKEPLAYEERKVNSRVRILD